MAEDKLTGTVIAEKYRVDKLIARGGFSKIYRGTQLGIDRPVALKILDLNEDIEATWLERFTQEARLVSQLQHSNTITIYDYGQVGRDYLYIAMEYIRGSSLGRYVKKKGPMSAERVARIGVEICRSLDEAHRQGILHRDLKPSNIMLYRGVEGEEAVKVLDFGVAKLLEPAPDVDLKLTQQGTFIGTPRYASPEQLRREELTPAADIYGVGMILWEALVGEPAVPDIEYGSCIKYHLGSDPWRLPPAADCPPGLASVVHKMLAKPVEERYQTCKEVIEDLQDWPEADTTERSGGEVSTRPALQNIDDLLEDDREPALLAGGLTEDEILRDAEKLASAAESGETTSDDDEFLSDLMGEPADEPSTTDFDEPSNAAPPPPSPPQPDSPGPDATQPDSPQPRGRSRAAPASKGTPDVRRPSTTSNLVGRDSAKIYAALGGAILVLLGLLYVSIGGDDPDDVAPREDIAAPEKVEEKLAEDDSREDHAPSFGAKTLIMAIKTAGWKVGNTDVNELDGVVQTNAMAMKKRMAASFSIYETNDVELAQEIAKQTRPPAEAVRFGHTVVRVSPGPKQARNGVYSLTGALFTFKAVAEEEGAAAARRKALEERK